ncbi:hypothetical protein [Streptomyces sp. NPDC001744]
MPPSGPPPRPPAPSAARVPAVLLAAGHVPGARRAARAVTVAVAP